MNQIIFCFAFLFMCYNGFSQSYNYRSYHYEWPAEKPKPLAVSDNYKNEDAIILTEKCVYNAGGNRVPGYSVMNFQANYVFVDVSVQGATPVVQKHLRIKYLTQKGIDKFSRFVLPESFDPHFDYYNVRPQLRDSSLRPVGEFLCIRYFAARVINPDGSARKAEYSETISNFFVLGDRNVEKYYNWIFTLKNIKIGDELELDYSYEGAYNYGYNNRIFFNGEIPIQNLDLTLRFPEKETYILSYHNGIAPVDSMMTTPSVPHYTEYYFHLENIDGGINEAGSRPHLQLPYLTYYLHNLDFGIEDPATKFIIKALPYPWPYVLLPYAGYKYQDLKTRLSRIDKTTVVLNQMTEDAKAKAKDTSAASILTVIQHDLAENYFYQEDKGYYNGREPDNENLGKNLENKVLRQMSRLRIYDEILMRLDRPYYHAILMDKRISDINDIRFESFLACRWAVAIPYKDYLIFNYPKSYRFGYESNELPFYYEDIRTFLVPQSESWEKKFELVPNVQFMFVKTPLSSIKDNVRNTSGMVNISLDSLRVNLIAKIRLSGQFSTLTRGFYKYGNMDTTINPQYYKCIDIMADDKNSVNKTVSEVHGVYPFDVTVNEKFKADKIIHKTEGKEYEIDLSCWFNNVIDNNFLAAGRHLDYYPDFQSHDLHRYMIHFDHKVKVENIESFQKDIDNSFAKYEFKVSQPAVNDILFESSYAVKAMSVPASQAMDVEEIFNSIRAINNSKLRISSID